MLELFFNSFILPLFDYGDIIWGDHGNVSLMSELKVLQNKAARLTLVLPAHFPAAEAIKRLGWKPLLRRRKEHHAIFMYKLINNHFCHSIPVTFNGDFIVTTQDREMTFANPVPQEDGVIGRQ